MFRVSKISMCTVMAIAAMAVPAAAVTYSDGPGGSSPRGQDLRSADASDAALNLESRQVGSQDLRSPDTSDAAAGRGTFSAPEVTVVRVSEPTTASGGLDWGDAGIGAAGLLGVILVGLGGTMFVLHRRHSHPPAAAA
jgi:hypothetical protein